MEDKAAEIRNLTNTAIGLRHRSELSLQEAEQCEARAKNLQAEIDPAPDPGSPAPAN